MAKLNEICNKLLDLVFLTIYWFVSCLPIVTIGTATSALYYTTQKVIKNGRGYVSGEFWHFFKKNFKVSTKCWLVHLILGFIFADEAYICYQMWRDGVTIGWMWIPFVVLEAFNLVMVIFTLTYIARFEDGAKRTLKNSFFIMMTHLVKGILLLLLLAVFVVAVVYFPPLILLAPASYMLLASYVLEKIFRKYMSKEDLAAEQERNRVWQ